MTKDELRHHFDLKPCPNPPHDFRFGRLMGELRWAEDCWSQLVDDKLQTLYLSVHKTKTVEGTTIYSITFFKLKIIWGVVQ